MARTKQTAKKSCGERSTRVKFAIPTKSIVPAPRQIVLKMSKSNIDRHDVWCCGCGNGGERVDCSYCLRTMCFDCVKYDDPQQLTREPDVTFKCIKCHTTAPSRGVAYHPLYQGGEPIESITGRIGPATIRAKYPRMNTESLAVLELHLASICYEGLTSISVNNNLFNYYKNPSNGHELIRFKHAIDVNPEDPKSIKNHQKTLSAFVGELKRKNVKRLLVFVNTHSNPENGDLHCANGIGIEADVFLREIIGPDIISFATNAHSMLFLQVCGGIWRSLESSTAVYAFAKSGFFNYIIGFKSQDFVPHTSTTLLTKFTQKHFIECFSVLRSLPSLLKEEEELGSHTSVIVLSQTFGLSYFWCHDTICPYGDKIPLQCLDPTCNVIQKLRFKNVKTWVYKRSCKCGWSIVKDATIPNAVLPKAVNGQIKGWGNELLYGTRARVEEVQQAPKETYDTI